MDAPAAPGHLATSPDQVHVDATAYEVSALPVGHPMRRYFTLTVAWRSPGRWAVTDGAYCIGKRGNRTYESLPSSRSDRFVNAYRFDLDEALTIARKQCLKMTVNGHTLADAFGMEA